MPSADGLSVWMIFWWPLFCLLFAGTWIVSSLHLCSLLTFYSDIMHHPLRWDTDFSHWSVTPPSTSYYVLCRGATQNFLLLKLLHTGNPCLGWVSSLMTQTIYSRGASLLYRRPYILVLLHGESIIYPGNNQSSYPIFASH